MHPVIIHLSNLHNSAVSLHGDIHFNGLKDCTSGTELLLQSLELNRQLITGICSQWQNEEELFAEIQKLIEKQKALELSVVQFLQLWSDGEFFQNIQESLLLWSEGKISRGRWRTVWIIYIPSVLDWSFRREIMLKECRLTGRNGSQSLLPCIFQEIGEMRLQKSLECHRSRESF